MRRLYLLLVLAVAGLVGCEKEKKDEGVVWDFRQYSATFDIVDGTGNHMLYGDENAIYDIEVVYEGQTYQFDAVTRDTYMNPFAIRRTENQNYFNVGEVCWGTSGNFTIKFRGNSWNVRFETSISAGKTRDDLPIRSARIWVDDNPSVDGKSIIQLLYTPVDE